MISEKKKLLWRDSFFCTILTLLVSGILLLIFVNVNILDPFYRAFKDFSFTDIYHSKIHKTNKIDKDIIIVNIQHADRFTIAQAIEKIQKQNPKVIGLDAIFKEQKEMFTDSVLKSALNKHNNIVTSYYFENDTLIKNHDYFRNEKPVEGFINVNFDNKDKVIRSFRGYKTPENKLSFATQVALKSGKLSHFDSKKLNEGIPINYFGNLNAFLIFDIQELLELESIPSMRDKIVLLGYLGTPTGNPFDIEDKHFTPLNENFAGKSTPDMYGVLIHANVIKMLTSGNFITKVPDYLVYLIAIICCFFLTMFGMRFYKRSTLAFDVLIKLYQLSISIVLLYLALLLLKVNVYLSVTPILILILFGLEMIDFYAYLLDYLKKRYQWKSYLLD
ncbi:CHASE2 domain-containing protein [Seonamhaeicola sp. ML3]|uniref:CHASE2 domain-containing protein n=1 Tax=Seonamhaeicola sp. ML3 TaxID=2937786 RepID=UPI00200C13CB|nr:CHASE2 domain-containing protein [Seonamhaeicola sp. ML3]